MRLNTSSSQILSISIPIMLGSAAQNIIVLCDNVFLFHLSDLDFAAIGIVGVFYLIIASIGYGFSRGGQIFIARKNGEGNYRGVGQYFRALLLFEIILAGIMFAFLQLCSPWFFGLFIDNPDIYEKCLEYIYPRSYGVFFSYIGVSFIALYTGIARTKFIVYDTIILTIVNVVLNYVFIFGSFGIEGMGIAGAGLASTISEVVAFIAFLIYMFFETDNRKYKLFTFPKPNFKLQWQVFSVSSPIVLQAILGLGSWFVFFALIENMGQRSLEISNLTRNVYLILSIPCWGFSAGINTIVSNFIGGQKRQAVIPMIRKTARLSALVTLGISIPVAVFPEFFLYPLFGGDDMSLIQESSQILWLLCLILVVFSIGAIYMNGLMGTGHTKTALWIQAIFSVFYVVYAYYVISVFDKGLMWAWFTEVIYWFGIGSMVMIYLRSRKWHERKF